MSSRSIAIAAPPLCCALTQVNEAANTPARANELTLGFTRKFMTFSNPNVQRVCNCALYGSESRYPDSDAHRYPAGTLGPKAVNVNRARWLFCEVKRIRLTVATDCARKGHLFDIPTTVAVSACRSQHSSGGASMKKVVSFVFSTVPCVVAVSVTCGMSSLLARQLPNGPGPLREAEQKNMELVGTNDLQARSAYQPVVQHQGNRWILYVGHHTLDKNPATGRPLPSLNRLTGKSEENGTSIVDVTDPQKPVYLHHLPVANGTGGGAQMVRVCDGNTLPVHDNKFYLLRSYANTAHEILDVTNPSAPRPVRTVAGGNPVIGNLAGTHKSWWECDTGIAYIVGNRSSDAAAGWKRGNHIMIFDLSNPASPVFKRDWALDGQQPGGQVPANFAAVPSIHGPISTGPAGNRVYFAYGTSSNGVRQFVDRSKLLS